MAAQREHTRWRGYWMLHASSLTASKGPSTSGPNRTTRSSVWAGPGHPLEGPEVQSSHSCGSGHGVAHATRTFLLVLAALTALSGLGSPAPAQERSSKVPAFMQSPLRTDSEPIHIRLAGHDYDLPANYLDSPLEGAGPTYRSVLLVALLPELQARTKQNWDEFMKVPGYGRRVHILVTVPEAPDGVLERIRSGRERSNPTTPAAYRVFDLIFRRPAPSTSRWIKREVMVDQPGNDDAAAIRGFIECVRYGDVPEPGCSHFFTENDVVFKVSYSREELSRWRAIMCSVKALFRSFEREPTIRLCVDHSSLDGQQE